MLSEEVRRLSERVTEVPTGEIETDGCQALQLQLSSFQQSHDWSAFGQGLPAPVHSKRGFLQRWSRVRLGHGNLMPEPTLTL